MTALVPVLRRELRVASRRHATYWTRFTAGLIASGVLGFVLLMVEIASAFGGPFPAGQVLYYTFATYGTLAVLSGGLFLATDSIASERREGTLGLLLLTRLRAHDLLLAKLGAGLLRSGQWLFAAVPPAATMLLFGGIAPGRVAGLALALANGLFWSIAIALAVSAWFEKWSMAFFTTALLLTGGAVLPMVIDAMGLHGVTLASPVTTITRIGGPFPEEYWLSLGIVHAQGWLALLIATWWLRRPPGESRMTAAHPPPPPAAKNAGATPPVMPASPVPGEVPSPRPHRDEARRILRRRRALEPHPTGWLAAREPALGRFLKLVTAGALAGIVAGVSLVDWNLLILAGSMVTGLFTMMLILYVSATAGRHLAEAARTGLIDLVLITPTTTASICAGQIRALARTLLFPAAAVMFLQATITLVGADQFRAMPTLQGKEFGNHQFVSGLMDVAVLPVTLSAIAWVGLLMGLYWRSAGKAFGFTLLLGWLVPGIATSVATAMMTPIAMDGAAPGWLTGLLSGAAGLGMHLAVLLGARHCLLQNFRALAAGDLRLS